MWHKPRGRKKARKMCLETRGRKHLKEESDFKGSKNITQCEHQKNMYLLDVLEAVETIMRPGLM